MRRTLEPEVMDTEEEARDYDAMNHSGVNARFCDDLLGVIESPVRALDMGTGTALIPIELCRRVSQAEVHAVDLATAMLALAQRNVERAGLGARVHLQLGDAKKTHFASGAFDAVVSNSLVHHMPDPEPLMREMYRLVRPRGVLFVRDLARPESSAQVRDLVRIYAAVPDSTDAHLTAMHERQRELFEASLHAALTVDEVVALVAALDIPGDAVRLTSDRHWTLSYVAPA